MQDVFGNFASSIYLEYFIEILIIYLIIYTFLRFM